MYTAYASRKGIRKIVLIFLQPKSPIYGNIPYGKCAHGDDIVIVRYKI